jgi:hypothetical protein
MGGAVHQSAAQEASAKRRARAVSADLGAAWLLDAKSFHDEFDELFAGLGDRDGLERCWGRALGVCGDADPEVRRYLATVEVRPPQQWATRFDEAHLAEWYRILMAPHLRPTPGLQSPGAVKDRLPDLGWARGECRKLAFGRELCTMAQSYGDPECAEALCAALPVGAKGWLSQDDIGRFLDALHALDRDRFRQFQNLVPVVDDIYHVLGAAAAASGRVLLLPPG